MSPPDLLSEIDAMTAELTPGLERPEPRREWTRELDARAAAGFPRRRRSRARGLAWAPALAPVAGLIVLALVLTNLPGGHPGTSSSGSGASGGSAAVTPPPTQAAPASSAGGTSTGMLAPRAAPQLSQLRSRSATSAPPQPIPRRVERATQLLLGVRPAKMQATAQRVIATTSDFGGIVLSSTVSSGDAPNASFSLRFPSGRVGEAVARLARLGRVRSQTSTSRDVTRGFLTAQEELAAARAERAGELKALGNATTQGQIDSLKRRLALADDRVRSARAGIDRARARTDFSRVSLQLVADRGGVASPPTRDSGWSPGDALHTAGRVLAVSAGVGLVALACLVPLGVVALLAGLGGRTLRRRRREAALA